MDIDELTRDLQGGPAVPSIRLDAVETIISGAATIRRRRHRMAIVASVSAVFLTVAVIVGGSTVLGGRSGPGPVPVARSVSTAGITVTTTYSSGSPHPTVANSVVSSVAGNAAVTVGSLVGSPPTSAQPSRASGSRGVTSSQETSSVANQNSARQSLGKQDGGNQQGANQDTGSGGLTASEQSGSTTNSEVSGTGLLHLQSFRLPSQNIGCRMMTGVLGPQAICAIEEFDGTGCQAAWNHQLKIDLTGAKYCEPGPVVAVPDGPVLKYGQVNVVGGLVCASNQVTGLTCTSPYDGSAFWVNRTGLGNHPGDSGGTAARLQDGSGSPPVVPITGSGTYFGSADLSVLCKVSLTSPSNAAVTCAPNRAGSNSSSGAGGPAECSAAGQAAQLDLVSAGVSSTHFCGLTMNGANLPGVIAALTGKIPAGTTFTVNQGSCIAYAALVVCQADGTGFAMTAGGYADLGSHAQPESTVKTGTTVATATRVTTSTAVNIATTVTKSVYLDGSHLLPGLQVQTGSGACGTAADAVRPDEVACEVDGGAAAFPCFAFPNRLGVACADGDPASSKVLLLTNVRFTSTTFPGRPGVDAATRPWFLELADGTSCVRPAGPRSVGGGTSLTFDCGSSNSYVIGDPDASGSTWTVQRYPDSGAGSAQTVAVRHAWY